LSQSLVATTHTHVYLLCAFRPWSLCRGPRRFRSGRLRARPATRSRQASSRRPTGISCCTITTRVVMAECTAGVSRGSIQLFSLWPSPSHPRLDGRCHYCRAYRRLPYNSNDRYRNSLLSGGLCAQHGRPSMRAEGTHSQLPAGAQSLCRNWIECRNDT
jgi:hypothetical protein